MKRKDDKVVLIKNYSLDLNVNKNYSRPLEAWLTPLIFRFNVKASCMLNLIPLKSQHHI